MSTIVAAATPTGRGALAVVRLSGPRVAHVRDLVLRPLRTGPWKRGRTRRVALHDAQGVFDDGIAVFQQGPASYTGEDTLEITLHGNPLLVERLVAACRAAGAQLAGPGAFTRRAVLAGKLTLLGAEAVDLTIRARSPAGLAVARGVDALSLELQQIRERLVQIVAELEARLDYPADELALEADAALLAALQRVGVRCSSLAGTYRVGRRLVEGATVAIVGPTNVGKSSLFNALLGTERALVHDGPGTTRDVVESQLALEGLAIRLLDTAGERLTDDPIEAAGLALATALTEQADLLVLVGTPGHPALAQLVQRTEGRDRVLVHNQVDVQPADEGFLGVSARTGQGVGDLKRAIVERLVTTDSSQVLLGSLRQAQLAGAIARGCAEAVDAFELAGVAAAIDVLVVDAIEPLDELTGADTREDVLDVLFARFCIGK